MANPNIIEQARTLILTAQPDDAEARKTVLGLLNEYDFLVGAVRAKSAIEENFKMIIRRTIKGDTLFPNVQDYGTRLARIILNKSNLLEERLGLRENELPVARRFFLAMSEDLKPKDNI